MSAQEPDAHAADFEAALAEAAAAVEETLDDLLPEPRGPEARLHEAMRYACLAGGKRLRPFFVLQSGHIFGVDRRMMRRVAAAVECVHTYSLVHDDLPAMDDDDLRRGRPTVHKQFDEATAILAGDALLTLAFQILSDPETCADPFIRCTLVSELAKASGHQGMVGGQMIDLSVEGEEVPIVTVTRLQRMKTGALIDFACLSGAYVARAGEDARHALDAYAHDLGLAFQITDDLLDVEGAQDEAGKAVGKDAERGKATFVAALGPERARAQAELLLAQAEKHLGLFGAKAEPLRAATRFIAARSR